MKDWEEWELPNGIRIVHVYETHSLVAHCGLMINTGSRDEKDAEQGLAHFIEHGLFKGTKKRKAYHILNRIDSVGGELNAYTSKEETVIYASYGKEHFGRAVELISDVAFHSTFPEKELEKEKDVILDELNSYLDSPAEQIFDDFEELVFEGEPIGKNILGTESTVKSFSRQNILDFIAANYCTSEMVFSVVGNVKPKQVKYFADKYLANIPAARNVKERTFNAPLVPVQKNVQKNTHQCHFMMGSRAYGITDSKLTSLTLVNNILGGPAMNTRLHMALRERKGIAYHVESNYQPYTDTGITNIYIGTDKKAIPKCKKIIRAELDKLAHTALTSRQLESAKAQLKGHVLLSKESRVNAMLGLAKSLLHAKTIETEEEILAKINAVNSTMVMDVVNEIWCESNIYELIYV